MIKFGVFKISYYLCEEGAGDEDLHHHRDDQLEDEKDNRYRTLLCDAPEAVANCGLGFQREEEGPCQSLHLHYTRRVVGGGVKLCKNGGRKKDLQINYRRITLFLFSVLIPTPLSCLLHCLLVHRKE